MAAWDVSLLPSDGRIGPGMAFPAEHGNGIPPVEAVS